jgi:hypothetical protein
MIACVRNIVFANAKEEYHAPMASGLDTVGDATPPQPLIEVDELRAAAIEMSLAAHRTDDTPLLEAALAAISASYSTPMLINNTREAYAHSLRQLARIHDAWAIQTARILTLVHNAAEELLRRKGITVP